MASNRPIMRLTILVIVLAILSSAPGLAITKQSDRLKIILDTDIGDDIDDAWALAFVIAHAGFEPLGVTVTHGNTPARAKIACKLLHVSGRDDIPVFVGRKTNDRIFQQYSWAEDFTARRPSTKTAVDFIVDSVRRYPGQVTLVAVGPLENLGDALRKEPKLGSYVKRVVLMSGCVYGTTYSPGKPISEWNVRQSIDDAKLVYGASLPLTIVPLDSTTQVQLTEPERKQVADHQSPLTYSLECLYRLWLGSPTQRMTLHDQLAVAETARPGVFFAKQETLPLSVDGEGYTRIDRERGKPVSVCLDPKRDGFMKYYLSELISQSSR
ncbi:MAG TPA: nucleoside hydrolase [Blastocatellia bacterium]|nr:nucleoside hydrolase [Blastocatellia bacterium]